eukprot:SAG31_NODE_8279_length_1481_cov_3.246020_1_plen_51_part_01
MYRYLLRSHHQVDLDRPVHGLLNLGPSGEPVSGYYHRVSEPGHGLLMGCWW